LKKVNKDINSLKRKLAALQHRKAELEKVTTTDLTKPPSARRKQAQVHFPIWSTVAGRS